jgi:hypothetical protein
MFTIGLSYNEIAIIMGAVQAISFVATPIAGLGSIRVTFKYNYYLILKTFSLPQYVIVMK